MNDETIRALLSNLEDKIDKLDVRLEKLAGCVASLKGYKSWLTGAIAVLGGLGILGGCGTLLAAIGGKL